MSTAIRELRNMVTSVVVLCLMAMCLHFSPLAAQAFLRRYDLPLPLRHYLAGAGLVVAFTFVFLAIFRGDRTGQLPKGIDLSRTIFGRFLTSRSMRGALSIESALPGKKRGKNLVFSINYGRGRVLWMSST